MYNMHTKVYNNSWTQKYNTNLRLLFRDNSLCNVFIFSIQLRLYLSIRFRNQVIHRSRCISGKRDGAWGKCSMFVQVESN